jgi:hypothetical protein
MCSCVPAFKSTLRVIRCGQFTSWLALAYLQARAVVTWPSAAPAVPFLAFPPQQDTHTQEHDTRASQQSVDLQAGPGGGSCWGPAAVK